MPLKFLRVRVTRANTGDAVQVALSASSLAKELANMSLFPPAAAVVTILMLILQTVQSVADNKETCGRLARRCANILLDINDQMTGRWDTAPPTLIRNLERFEIILQSIQDFMQHLTDLSWKKRLLRRVSIENALAEYHAQLDDASRSFQIATLINIHYAVAAYPHRNIDETTAPVSSKSIEDKERNSDLSHCTHSVTVGMDDCMGPLISEAVGVDEFTQEHITSSPLEDHGFRRYHQSEIQLKGKATLRDGWWTGASIAEVDGQHALIKKYEGLKHTATRKWLRDVHILQSVFHPNFPRLIGFSSEDTPIPFILLSNVYTRSPQNLLSFIIEEKGVAETLAMLFNFYHDITDAIIYVTQQLDLTETKSQDFIEGASFRVDASNTIIIGPPPPQDGNWISFRNYNLTKSLTSTTLNLLPQKVITQYWRNNSEDQHKFASLNHIITLANGLLPSSNEHLHLPSAIQELFSSQSNVQLSPDLDLQQIHKPKITLRHLRLLSLMNGSHNHTWSESQAIPADHFRVGDFGYISRSSIKNRLDNSNEISNKSFVKDFIKLGNIFIEHLVDESGIETMELMDGTYWNWKDFPHQRRRLEGFQLLDNLHCWPVAVPPQQQIDCQVYHSKKFKKNGDGWKFLLENGRSIANKAQVAPEDIILITLAGKSQDFYIKDFTLAPFQKAHPISFAKNNHLQYPKQQQQHHHHNPFSPQVNGTPSILYLTTSIKRNFLPYWSHYPGLQAALRREWVTNIGWSHGYINWVQLHKEDFI